MKTIKFILGFFVLALAIEGITYLSQDNNTTHFSANSLAIPDESCDFAYSDTQALLFKESGDIFFTKPDEEVEKKLEIEQIYIPSGTKIRTANDGHAMIVFEDDSLMSIDENSEIEVNFDTGKVSVFQKAGDVWHRANSLVSGEESYEVKTPNAVATVRGTIFGISVHDDNDLDLLVFDGLVGLNQYNPNNENPIFSAEIPANQGVFASEGQPVMRELVVEDLQIEWIISNNKLDEKWKAAKDSHFAPHAYLRNLMTAELHPAAKEVKAVIQPIQRVKYVIQNSEPAPEAEDTLKELGTFLEDKYEGLIKIEATPFDKAATLIEVIEVNKISDDKAATLLEIKRLSGGSGGSSPPPPPNVTPLSDTPATEEPATEEPGLEFTENESTPNEITLGFSRIIATIFIF